MQLKITGLNATQQENMLQNQEQMFIVTSTAWGFHRQNAVQAGASVNEITQGIGNPGQYMLLSMLKTRGMRKTKVSI